MEGEEKVLSDVQGQWLPCILGGVHQLAGLSRLQKAVNATRSAFVLNRARGEREQQDKPSWEAPFG